MRTKLYLIPSTLGEAAPIDTIPAATLGVLHSLEHLIVESPKQARRFLAAAGFRLSERQTKFYILDEHTADAALPNLLAPALAGADVGLLSDAGCPAVADPGAKLVRMAHASGIAVMPLVGPSSIMLALMASGLNGQRFAFRGYLPVEARARTRALLALELQAKAQSETQVMIETPYRNNRLLAAILATCAPDTLLCLATELTLPGQYIATRPVAEWRGNILNLDRRPTVFLLATPGA